MQPRSQRTTPSEYIDRKKENVIFIPMQLSDLLLKFTAEMPFRYRGRGVYIPNLKQITLAKS